MPNTPIWPGSSSFFPGETPFGFYDNDIDFQTDADKVSQFCASRLGYPTVDVEMGSGSFYACFEEAVNEYGSQLYHFEIIDSFHTLEGNSTGIYLREKLGHKKL